MRLPRVPPAAIGDRAGFVDGKRPAEIIALNLGAAEILDHVMLLLGLDALGGRRHAEALCERDDGADDRDRLGHAFRRALDEAAVDLDRGEAGAAEIAERRIAGAEIVERQPDPEIEDAFEHLDGAGALVHEHAFGHFEFEPVRRQPALRQRRGDGRDEAGIVELLGRHIDRDPRRAGPARRFLASRPQHPFSDRPDQAGVLGERDELDGRHVAEFGMAPAQQCLEPCQQARIGGDDGLIVQMQLVVLHRLAQRHFEDPAFLCLDVQLRLIAVERAAAGILRPVEREIGRADQHFCRPAVARSDRDADARADIERMLIDLVGPGKRFDDPLGQPLDPRRIARVADHDRELVAAEPTDHLVLGHPV